MVPMITNIIVSAEPLLALVAEQTYRHLEWGTSIQTNLLTNIGLNCSSSWRSITLSMRATLWLQTDTHFSSYSLKSMSLASSWVSLAFSRLNIGFMVSLQHFSKHAFASSLIYCTFNWARFCTKSFRSICSYCNSCSRGSSDCSYACCCRLSIIASIF